MAVQRATSRRGARQGGSARSDRPRPTATPEAREVDAAEIAWLAVLPCTAIVLALILLLGEPLGDLLPSSHLTFWPSIAEAVTPEPTEQARFLLALTGPLLLSAAIVLGTRRRIRLPGEIVPVLVWTVQLLLVGFFVWCLVEQAAFTFGVRYANGGQPFHERYFTPATLVVAVLATAAFLAVVRNDRARSSLTMLLAESRRRAVIGWVLAVLAVVVWLLHAVNFEDTVAGANGAATFHLLFTLDETYAVLNGRSPLVDFAAQYGSLLPYGVAGVMRVAGTSTGVFVLTMLSLTGIALLAVFATLRRAARSTLGALLLFLPFVATSFFLLSGPLDNRYTFATIFSNYPLRLLGPWVLLWLTARHLDGERPRQAWPLFLVAGLVAINNADHGLPALGATVVAVVVAGGPLTWRRTGDLALQAIAGLLAACAIVALTLLLRTGSLPDPALLLRYARLFASAGYFMLPMPTFGLHLIIYCTFAAAIATAVVRVLRDTGHRSLTGALLWVGLFGLGAGAYYAGRSHPEVLIASFSPWALAVALLLIVVVQAAVARPRRIPAPAQIACVAGFALAVCSLAQTPTPWSQLERLSRDSEPALAHPVGEAFVADHVQPGERIAIIGFLGHRIAENLDVTNVSPYAAGESMPTEEQLDEVVDALREEDGRKVFLQLTPITPPEIQQGLMRRGFQPIALDEVNRINAWVDRRGR